LLLADMADRLGVPEWQVVGLGCLIVAQTALLLYALVDLARRKEVNGGRKWVWLLIILLMNLVGPIIYLAVGRNVPPRVDEPVPTVNDEQPRSRDERIRRGVDALFAERPAR
jgi:hypothetical protein